MIKHLFKIIWNKKKANALITIEILLSFLVLFTVVTMGTLALYRYNQPLGFQYNDVWAINIDTRLPDDSTYYSVKRATVQQILLQLKQMPEIENVCAWANPPYSHSESRYRDEINGKTVLTSINRGSEDAKDVFGFTIVEGRWFNTSDKAANWKPVVINERFRRERFGTDSALGKDPFSEKRKEPYRVVGVVSDFRKGGEFSPLVNQCIEYYDIEKTTQPYCSYLLIKVKPGTTMQFEEKLVKGMESVAGNWSFDVKSLDEMRSENFKPIISLLIAVGLIAGFLLLMVALGLIGVLWQNVSSRTPEIGLRRALGSTERKMYGQIVGELLVLTTFGLIIGTIIIAQFPLLNLIDVVPTAIYIKAFVISVVLMYLLTLFSALYPSWLTMGIEPAEALHYE